MKHYEGEIGIFDYDENVWKIDYVFDGESDKRIDYLTLVPNYKGEISLPKGIKSCYKMFWERDLKDCWFKDFDTCNITDMNCMFKDCEIPEGFSLGDNFDTSEVINMDFMFCECKMPEGFSLGDKFYTSNVTDMRKMFYGCKIPEGFSLGDKFDTSEVRNMDFMFCECKMPEGFSLGDKFDTSKVKDTKGMFWGCKMPEGFTLGDKFDTSKVKDMKGMFCECKMPEGFSLGDRFDTSNVKDMSRMFAYCKIPKGFSLGDRFDTSNVIDMRDMFVFCKMSEGFSLGDKFDTSNVKNMAYMFEKCKMPEGYSLGDKFDTSNVKDMSRMFAYCKIPKGFSLGDKFDTSNVENMEEMFDECYIGNKEIKDTDVETMKILLEKLNFNSKNKQKGVLTNMIAHKLVEDSTGNTIGIRIELDNIGVYADTTVSCFKKLCKLKNISPKKGKDIKVYKQGDTFISSGDESLVLEVQGFNLLDKLYCSDLKCNIEVHDLNYSNTRDAHEKICSIISSIDKFNNIVFVYVPEKYSAYLKVDIHFRKVEDIVDFALSYYNKKMDKINVGSEKYQLSKETLMSIPKDKLNSIGDFSADLKENGEEYVITGFFSLSDEGYMLD